MPISARAGLGGESGRNGPITRAQARRQKMLEVKGSNETTSQTLGKRKTPNSSAQTTGRSNIKVDRRSLKIEKRTGRAPARTRGKRAGIDKSKPDTDKSDHIRLALIQKDCLDASNREGPTLRVNIGIMVLGMMSHLAARNFPKYYLATLKLLIQIYKVSSRLPPDEVMNRLPAMMSYALGDLIEEGWQIDEAREFNEIFLDFPSQGTGQELTQCLVQWYGLFIGMEKGISQLGIDRHPISQTLEPLVKPDDLETLKRPVAQQKFDDLFSDLSSRTTACRVELSLCTDMINREMTWLKEFLDEIFKTSRAEMDDLKEGLRLKEEEHTHDLRTKKDTIKELEKQIQDLQQELESKKDDHSVALGAGRDGADVGKSHHMEKLQQQISEMEKSSCAARDKIKELDKKLEALAKERDHLKEERDNRASLITDLSNQVGALRATNVALDNNVKTVEDEKRDLQAQLNEKQKQIGEMKKESQGRQAEQRASDKAAERTSEEQNERIKRLNHELAAARGDTERSRQENEERGEEVGRMIKELDQLRTTVKNLTEASRQKDDDTAELQNDLQTKRKEAEKQKAEVTKLNSQIRSLESEIQKAGDESRQKMGDLKFQMEQKKREILKLEEQIEGKNGKITDLESDLESKAKVLEEWQETERQSSGKKQQEQDKVRELRDTVTTLRNELEETTSDLRNKKKTIQGLEANIKSQEVQAQRTKNQSEKFIKDLEERISRSDSQEVERQNHIATLKLDLENASRRELEKADELKCLNDKIQTLENSLENRSRTMADEGDKLKQTLESLRLELSSKANRLESAEELSEKARQEAQKRAERLQRELEDQRAENEVLHKQVQDLEQKAAHLKDTQKQATGLHELDDAGRCKEIQQLKEEVALQRGNAAKAREESEALRTKSQEMAETLGSKAAEVESLTSQIQHARDQICDLQARIDRSEKRVKSLEAELDNKGKQLQAAKVQARNSMDKKIDRQEEERAAERRELLRSHENTIQTLQDELERERAQNSKLENPMHDLKHEAAIDTVNSRTQTNGFEDLSDASKGAEELAKDACRVMGLQSENERLKTQVEAAREQLRETQDPDTGRPTWLAEQIQLLQTEATRMKKEIEALRLELKESKDLKSKMEAELEKQGGDRDTQIRSLQNQLQTQRKALESASREKESEAKDEVKMLESRVHLLQKQLDKETRLAGAAQCEISAPDEIHRAGGVICKPQRSLQSPTFRQSAPVERLLTQAAKTNSDGSQNWAVRRGSTNPSRTTQTSDNPVINFYGPRDHVVGVGNHPIMELQEGRHCDQDKGMAFVPEGDVFQQIELLLNRAKGMVPKHNTRLLKMEEEQPTRNLMAKQRQRAELKQLYPSRPYEMSTSDTETSAAQQNERVATRRDSQFSSKELQVKPTRRTKDGKTKAAPPKLQSSSRHSVACQPTPTPSEELLTGSRKAATKKRKSKAKTRQAEYVITLKDQKWSISKINKGDKSTTYHVYLAEKCQGTSRTIPLLQLLAIGDKKTAKRTVKKIKQFFVDNHMSLHDALAVTNIVLVENRIFELHFQDESKKRLPAHRLLKWGYHIAEMMGEPFVEEFKERMKDEITKGWQRIDGHSTGSV